MGFIPFEVLVKELPAQKATNFSQPDYLCRHNIITYMFSGAMTGIKRKSGHLFNRTAVFLPDNAPDGGTALFPLLQGAEKEASEVNLLIRGHLYTGAPACESDFKKLAPRYDIIHIASHSITDTVKYYLSAIPLTPSNNGSEDDYLHVYEILQLKLQAKLVVLSGCSTGFGRIRTIAGMQSIATAFFYAGVRTMAYTLWQLADRQSTRLVADFYSGLKKLKSPGRAMNDARLKTLRTGDPVTSHPFFWAAYVVNGNDRPLLIPEMLMKYAVLVLMLTSVNLRMNFTFTGRH
jgi:CHAT domain-containing protein